MKNFLMKSALVTSLMLLSVALLFSQSSGQEQKYEFRWATAPTGAALYPLGMAMVEDLKKSIPEISEKSSGFPSSGPVGNVTLVSQGKRANIAFSFSDMAGLSWNGEGPYKQKIRNVRNIVTLYPQVFQWVVWADSDIKTIPDLKGKRVSPFLKGLSAEFNARKVLAAYGMSYADMKVSFLGFADAPNNMRDGHLDALLATTFFYPFPAFIQLNSVRPIRLLTLDEDKIEKLVKENIGISRFVLPANTYKGIDYPVPGINTRCHIVVNEAMPAEIVYKITKVLVENLDKYGNMIKPMKTVQAEDMARDIGIPFHPGASKYYRERGFTK